MGLAAASVAAATRVGPAPTIAIIDVEGNRRIDADSIRAGIALKPGQPYDEAAADHSIKALFATGFYHDVSVRRDGPRVTVRVVENPIVASVAVAGNKAIAEKDLAVGRQLRPGEPYTLAKARLEAQRMLALYRAQGRSDTRIEPAASPRADGRVDITFTVHEGAVERIGHIVFKGNQAIDARRLKDVMASTESGWLDFVRSSSTIDTTRFAADQALLVEAYRRDGFADARVEMPRLIGEGDDLQLEITISEGPRYTLAAPRLVSTIAGFDASGYGDLARLTPGAAYDGEALDKALDAIALKLAEEGPDFAEVRLVLERQQTRHVITPVFHFEPGRRLSVRRIVIAGNTSTNERVIRREMSLVEGRPFSIALARHDKAKLERTGLFKSVDIEASATAEPGSVRVTVRVVEQDTRKVDYGIGYSFTYGVSGDVTLSENNLLGTGDRLKLSVLAAEAKWQASLGFTDPHFFDTPFSAGFDLLYRDADYTTQSSFQMRTYGGDVRSDVPLSDNLSLGVKYSAQVNEIHDVGTAASLVIRDAVPGFPATTTASYLTSAIGTSLTWDDRDKKRLPTSGAYVALSEDFAGLGGDTHYLKTTTDARVYVPLSRDVTLEGRAVAGSIIGLGGDDVRLLDLFYKGGETVRGFASSGIGPRDTGSANQDAVGGTSYVAVTAAAMFALPYVPESSGLKSEVFADAGSLWGTNQAAATLASLSGAAPAPRVSVGAGLIWDSPLGAFRLDYAVPIVKQAFDKTQNLYFGMVP